MIDIEDLMCGNWIYLSDPEDREGTRDIYRIDEVCREYIRVEDFGDFYDDIYIKPIPVTVDMLKRIGFEEQYYLGFLFYRYWDKESRYKLDVYSDFCNSDRKFSIHIDNDVCSTLGSGEFTYVHELQNIVRIITGFSLPITKEMIYGLDDDAQKR